MDLGNSSKWSHLAATCFWVKVQRGFSCPGKGGEQWLCPAFLLGTGPAQPESLWPEPQKYIPFLEIHKTPPGNPGHVRGRSPSAGGKQLFWGQPGPLRGELSVWETRDLSSALPKL